MTKSTITRERIQRIIRAINSEAYDEEEIREWLSSDEIMELSRMALAEMDSETVEMPLDYLQGHKDGLEWASRLAEANHHDTGDWLYDDPIELAKAIRKGPNMPPAQPAPVVPDELNTRTANDVMNEHLSWKDYGDAEVFCIAWNACRAAMLASAPQSPGSEPATVPGSWIPVSERMPIEFEAVIAFDGDQVYGEAMYSSDDGFTIDGYEPCDRLNLRNVTHWMQLPAAPQEVK
ncbi:DUF551 domain-containing protein [Klebsiella pneumoniae]|uniref:DUF551 domain-containing protein n=1 Tax=Klebsiella pneumoniae TaxID=573 RepID=UPI001083EA1C|nr:DUF551 domain-containing protein [Klebsiella pneumoniae]VGC91376.1 Eaa1 [Klebsiella pneumoniae]